MANDNNKAWTCQELVDHADNWSLAGNAGLLKHMEQFAQNLFKQADETNNNLEDLMRDLDSTEVQLDLVKNRFLGLQNTQFIESRVYEDDETVVGEEIIEPKEEKLSDETKRQMIKSTVLDGLNVLDKYYDRVSIPIESDSESDADETDFANYVLREKDPYINRPLPYVIGTDEWHTKWHAGLQESDEDDEDAEHPGDEHNGNIEDEFSDTDSESHLPIADRRQYQYIDDSISMNNDNDNDSAVAIGDGHYEEVNGNSLSSKAPIANLTFAEQLAAKLGDVLNSEADPDLQVNTRPIQKAPKASSSLLPDMPPLLPPDEPEVPASQGLFSGGGGLFDDNSDDDSWRKPPPITAPSGQSNAKQSKKINLFDEDEDDDDFLAGAISPLTNPTSTPTPTPKPRVNPNASASASSNVLNVSHNLGKDGAKTKRIGGLFDESDTDEETTHKTKSPEILERETQKETVGVRKTIGGVNVLAGFLPNRRQSSSSSGSGSGVGSGLGAGKQPEIKESEKAEKRVLSLFDDTDDLFEDDLFNVTPIKTNQKSPSNANDKGAVKGLFDDNSSPVNVDSETIPPPIIASQKKIVQVENETEKIPKTKTSKAKITKLNLFDESSNDDKSNSDEDMFVTKSKTVQVPKIDQPKREKSLFDDFDDDEQEQGGLFQEEVSLGNKQVIRDLGKQSVDLFDDDKPPILQPEPEMPGEDDWETQSNRSDHISGTLSGTPSELKIDEVMKVPPPIATKPSPKSLKPPQLIHKQEKQDEETIAENVLQSPEKKLPGKLKHSLNINIDALMPGAKLNKPTTDVKDENTLPEPEVTETVTTELAVSESLVGQQTQDGGSGVRVLESVTKNRARIMVKRRPSTRQARKAALFRNASEDSLSAPNSEIPENISSESALDLTNEVRQSTPRKQLILDEPEADDQKPVPPPLDFDEVAIFPPLDSDSDKKDTTPKKISLFDDLDFDERTDDVFVPHSVSQTTSSASKAISKPIDLFANMDTVPPPLDDFFDDYKVERSPEVIKGLFNTSLDDDNDDIFADTSIISSPSTVSKAKTPASVQVPSDIFDDFDSGDLFAPQIKTSNISATDIVDKKDKRKKSLFGFDDEDQEDLFGFASTTTISKTQAQQSAKRSKSLFGDEDDDDIFGNPRKDKDSKPKSQISPVLIRPMTKVTSSTSSGGISSKNKSTVTATTRVVKDPLAAIFDDSD